MRVMALWRRKAAPPGALPTPDDPIHVALDVRTWSMSGLGTYVRELLRAASSENLPIAWTLIGPEAKLRGAMPEGLVIERWIDFDAPIYGRCWFKYPDPGPVDLFHYPHYNMPRVRARRRVTTIFDLFHLQYGDWRRQLYQRLLLSWVRFKRATVVTAAEKGRRELEDLAGIRPSRIHVIALGPGRPRRVEPTHPLQLHTMSGRPLTAPWLLATGIDQPHKNIDFLIDAMSLYYQRRPDAPPLVWIGLNDAGREEREKNMPASLRERVLLLPYGNEAEIEALFDGACALAFPSIDEGFGFPPLEAMARGVPVLSSRREPMTDLLGDAALYFDPNDSASLWRVLDRVLDHPTVREEIVRRGHERIQYFDWRHTAHETFGLYCRMIGRTGPEPEEPEPGGEENVSA